MLTTLYLILGMIGAALVIVGVMAGLMLLVMHFAVRVGGHQ